MAWRLRNKIGYRTKYALPNQPNAIYNALMSDRMTQLMKMLEREPTDPFLLYGVAMEHKKVGRSEDAIEFFEKTIAVDSGYCYAFYQLGQVFEQLEKPDLARKWYEEGIVAARVKGDDHARSELETALSLI